MTPVTVILSPFAGLALLIVGYAVFGLAPTAWTFVGGIPFLCLGGLAGPPAQSMITHQVGPGEQGRLQGALTSLQSLAGIFGPALFANVFALFIGSHAPTRRLPGVAFVLAAALASAALLLSGSSVGSRERADTGTCAALDRDQPSGRRAGVFSATADETHGSAGGASRRDRDPK